MPLLTIGTLHPLSDSIHCKKVSGTESMLEKQRCQNQVTI